LTKGLTASKEINIGTSYSGKEELKLTIDRLVLSPSQSRLLYTVDQSPELMKFADDGFGIRQANLHYYITDEHNKKVAIYGAENIHSGAETTEGVIQHPPLPKSKYYVFHLTGISHSSVVNESISITKKKLPVTKHTNYGKITISAIKKVDGNTMIEIEGTRPKNIESYGWIVRDENGQPQELFTSGTNQEKVQGEMVTFKGEIGINGDLETDNLQLQLYAVKKYCPANWSFQINGQ
jgi:hypothetical protein